MSWTTIIAMLYLFCEAAAPAAPPEFKWIFDSLSKALVGAGFVVAADHKTKGPVITMPWTPPPTSPPAPVQVVVNEPQQEKPKE